MFVFTLRAYGYLCGEEIRSRSLAASRRFWRSRQPVAWHECSRPLLSAAVHQTTPTDHVFLLACFNCTNREALLCTPHFSCLPTVRFIVFVIPDKVASPALSKEFEWASWSVTRVSPDVASPSEGPRLRTLNMSLLWFLGGVHRGWVTFTFVLLSRLSVGATMCDCAEQLPASLVNCYTCRQSATSFGHCCVSRLCCLVSLYEHTRDVVYA